MAKLFEVTAFEAFHNPAERSPPRKCNPDTGEHFLRQVTAWVALAAEASFSTRNRILWIDGPVGSVKSAISQILSEDFARLKTLDASFFFFSSPKPPEQSKIFYLSHLKHYSVLSYRRRAFTIVVDGLDECEGDDVQCSILNHISSLIHDHCLPLAFVVYSRPEMHIHNHLQRDPLLSKIASCVLPESSDYGIRIFLTVGFKEIRHNHEIIKRMVDVEWPTATDMQKLLQRSSGYFIYPLIVVKFVGNQDVHPMEQLKLVLSGYPSPFEKELDFLYHQIIKTVLGPTLLKHILGYISVSNQPLSTSMIDTLLVRQSGATQLALRQMRPLSEFLGDHDSREAVGGWHII
jgi:hypothetical protein